jgi:hypothetical protein
MRSMSFCIPVEGMKVKTRRAVNILEAVIEILAEREMNYRGMGVELTNWGVSVEPVSIEQEC